MEQPFLVSDVWSIILSHVDVDDFDSMYTISILCKSIMNVIESSARKVYILGGTGTKLPNGASHGVTDISIDGEHRKYIQNYRFGKQHGLSFSDITIDKGHSDDSRSQTLEYFKQGEHNGLCLRYNQKDDENQYNLYVEFYERGILLAGRLDYFKLVDPGGGYFAYPEIDEVYNDLSLIIKNAVKCIPSDEPTHCCFTKHKPGTTTWLDSLVDSNRKPSLERFKYIIEQDLDGFFIKEMCDRCTLSKLTIEDMNSLLIPVPSPADDSSGSVDMKHVGDVPRSARTSSSRLGASEDVPVSERTSSSRLSASEDDLLWYSIVETLTWLNDVVMPDLFNMMEELGKIILLERKLNFHTRVSEK
jgi:hypothetical protein